MFCNHRKIYIYIYLILIISFISCKHFNHDDRLPIPVEVVKVQLHSDTLFQDYIGKIEEEYASSLSFSVPGNVNEVYVQEGQYVRKGTLLATINKENLQSTYSAAVAIRKQAEDAYTRLQQLHEKGSIPEIQWIEMLTNLEKARSEESIAKKNLSESNLYAPFDGIIGKRKIEKGMFVLPTMEAIRLLSTKNIIVKVPIPENIISGVHSGQKATVTVGALNNRHYKSKVDLKGIEANLFSHSYEITLPIDNNDKQLMPGMICKVQLFSNDTLNVITLPIQAVKLSHTGEHFVWLAVDNTAKKRTVTIGNLSDNGIIIENGLNENDLVIIKGYQKVSEGTQINIE